jgi:Na+/H+ antiporter NhaD/arsenite permease-like protein
LGDERIVAAILFGVVYLALALFKRIRPWSLWTGIVIAIPLGLIPPAPWEFLRDINWNVMGIFAGTLVLADLFLRSRVPELIADWIIDHSPNVGMASIAICAISSFLSIFVENVATVLIVAPIALQMARSSKVSPVTLLIGIAIASNLQGTATLIGDPPSMILASYERMNFLDFFFYQGRPSIFFAVQIGAVISLAVLFLFYRRNRAPVVQIELVKVESWVPTYLIVVMILLLSLSSIVDPDFVWFGGTVCAVLAAGSVVWAGARDRLMPGRLFRSYDWGTTFFLAGVFVMVAMLERSGAIEAFAGFLSNTLGENPFLAFMFIVWVSVLFSAFIDNIPYITAMIPVVAAVGAGMAVPHELLVFGLLIGSCLGGNITPVGASANIVAVGVLRREGHLVSFGRFMSVGLPYTLAATLPAALFIWFVWR